MSDTLLTQEEIDALLQGNSGGDNNQQDSPEDTSGGGSGGNGSFTNEELDALKEFFVLLSNGAASVLITLANNENAKCEFNSIEVKELGEISEKINGFSHMNMNFNEGFEFSSEVFLSQDFIKNIASMMLGGAEIDQLAPEFISAAEAFFDQVFGSVIMLWKNRYDIAGRYVPPKLDELKDPSSTGLSGDVVSTVFKLAMTDEDESELFILFSVEEAKKLLSKIMKGEASSVLKETAPESSDDGLSQEEIDAMMKDPATTEAPPEPVVEKNEPVKKAEPEYEEDDDDDDEYEDDDEEEEEYEEAPPKVRKKKKKKNKVTSNGRKLKRKSGFDDDDVSDVQFADIDEEEVVELPSNIDLLLDVPLQITVELGRTKMLVKEILELGTGSVIELERLAGESIDVLVNGKLIAKGEVVVIDENFGIRITSIVSPNERIARLT